MIHRNIKWLEHNRGIRIRLHPWRLLVFIQQGWYHWLRVSRIATLPTVQTTTRLRSGAISPVSAPSRLPTQASTLLQAPANIQRLAQPPSAPAQDITSGQVSRNPSTSAFRVPRELSSGRLARNTVSGSVSSSGSRLSRHGRSVASGSAPTRQTPSQSESASASNLLPVTGPPVNLSASANADIVRYTKGFLDHAAEQREREANQNIQASQAVNDQNERAHRLTERFVHMGMRQTEHQMEVDAHRTRQEEQLWAERARLEEQLRAEREQLRIERMRHEEQMRLERAQHEERMRIERAQQADQAQFNNARNQVEVMALSQLTAQLSHVFIREPGTVADPSPSPQPVTQTQFINMLDQARTHVAQAMCYPLSMMSSVPAHVLPPMGYSYSPPFSYPYTSFARAEQGQAGPSRHANRLRDLTPTRGNPSGEDRFEDIGTVAGTPRIQAARDDVMEVERLELHGEPDSGEVGGQGAKGKGPPRND
ncbi:hypothetical protein FRC07_010759 [Ceratobasidium sp. 392]|nr:hypothetical protein FRC07_010759 [Ceratobasidium sp. 392]